MRDSRGEQVDQMKRAQRLASRPQKRERDIVVGQSVRRVVAMMVRHGLCGHGAALKLVLPEKGIREPQPRSVRRKRGEGSADRSPKHIKGRLSSTMWRPRGMTDGRFAAESSIRVDMPPKSAEASHTV